MSHRSHGNHRNHGSHGSYKDYRTEEPFYDYHEPRQLDWRNWEDNSSTLEETTQKSISQIKELREKINYLKENKAAPSQPPDSNPPIDLSNVSNDTFDGTGVDIVDDVQYNSLKQSLDVLKQHITGTASNLSEISEGEFLQKSPFENLKTKIDNLSLYDAGSYSNHNNHGSHGSYKNHRNSD